MVRLEEIEDEEFTREKQAGQDDDGDYTDTDSSISSPSDLGNAADLDADLDLDESLRERLAALRDIIPPPTRRRIASTYSTASSYVRSTLSFGGKGVFALATSLLFLGVPFALAVGEEVAMLEMEKEQRMREMGNELLTPGAAAGAGEGARQTL